MSESSEVVTLRSYLVDAERAELRQRWSRSYRAGAVLMRGEAIERAAWEARVCGYGEQVIKHIEGVEVL